MASSAHLAGWQGRSVWTSAWGLTVACLLMPAAALAGPTWDGLKPDVFGDRAILDGREVVELSAPTRPDDQSAVPVAVNARFQDGRTIKSVSIIVDENPSPVAAVFTIGGQRPHVRLAANFRFNAETDVRAVIEASDGQLYMVERHVKFAGGQASCSAPPQGDPEEIRATMGQMKLANASAPAAMSQIEAKARLDISHPNHTGMVLDQISLLYIPLRIVSQVDVRQGDELVFSMAGSMTLSQNPSIDFDYRVNGAHALDVTISDSDGVSWQQSFPVGHAS
ncbi:Sulfur oxidation protein SoxZ [Candidatus Filomicrobium marinum]|uniref:Sulfur oxidation protein SoxZ n=1 Tax=Candidatus Filomicrobium marinum TaxID=1608628 RepID=A0A0D6JEH5_9HYPH|nr:quinoprotein dehydrogenase-associated SoxYZ-like carrier [Candidatus Filomicrobium marinum]CFX16509.1 Sulfur oxidation protein SoxZ [Candidatus Filomicrobium marinum]CPR18105.1 Sulfur oxidation protein SoxZ [Candidatus Filomicrobium marinum]